MFAIALIETTYAASEFEKNPALSDETIRDQTRSAFAAGHGEAILMAAEASESGDNGVESAGEGAAFIGDPAAIGLGRQLYGNTCLFCHGAKGVGARAPTLVAGAWAPGRGNTPEYMFDTVTEGRPGTIMGAYKEILQPQEIWQIVAYLRDQADALAAKK